jgi:Tripartite tricarboxylate transporter family receptor
LVVAALKTASAASREVVVLRVLSAELQAEALALAEKTPIDPTWFAFQICEVLDDNSIMLDDTLSHNPLSRFLKSSRPGSYFRNPGSGGGWGPGAALGAKLGAPDRDIVMVAVTTKQRWAELPDAPTVANTLPGYEVISFLGVAAPGGTPGPIVAKLNSEIRHVFDLADIRERFKALGGEQRPATAGETQAFVSGEIRKWKDVVSARGINANRPLVASFGRFGESV